MLIINKIIPVSIALIQTQTDEKPRNPKKSRNSLVEPIVEEMMEIGSKSLSIISNEVKIDSSIDVAIIGNNLEDIQPAIRRKNRPKEPLVLEKPEILPPKRRRPRLNYGVINNKGFNDDECLVQIDNPTNDIQNQTNEKPITPSCIEPIVEEMKVVENKSLSIIPDGENIDSNELEIISLVEHEKTMEPETNDEIMSSENKSLKQLVSLDSLRINMEANQVHPLFGTKIHTLSRSALPSKLQIINFIRFKIDSTTKKHYSRKEKNKMYSEVAKELISIWKEAYIVCFDEKCVTDKIKRNIIPLMVAETYRKFPNEERKKDKLLELKKIFDIARCPCFR